jgi:hypothetical protein
LKTTRSEPSKAASKAGPSHRNQLQPGQIANRVASPLTGFEFSGAGPFDLQGAGFRFNFVQTETLLTAQNTARRTSRGEFLSGG